jgi:hypothetical protein
VYIGTQKHIMYTYIGTNVFEELPCYLVFSFFVEMLIQYAELIYTRSDKVFVYRYTLHVTRSTYDSNTEDIYLYSVSSLFFTVNSLLLLEQEDNL